MRPHVPRGPRKAGFSFADEYHKVHGIRVFHVDHQRLVWICNVFCN